MLLGCRVDPGGGLTRVAERRVDTALRAFEAGSSDRVIVSGGRRWGARSEAEVMGEALLARGVPEAAIVLELLSLSTCENARYSAVIARRLGAQVVGVVTCDWHMRRALDAFAVAGVSARAVPAETPRAPVSERVLRAGRERLSGWVDRVATWGAFHP